MGNTRRGSRVTHCMVCKGGLDENGGGGRIDRCASLDPGAGASGDGRIATGFEPCPEKE